MLKYCQLSWVLIISGTYSHDTLSNGFLKRLKSALLKSGVVSLLQSLFAAIRISNSTKDSLELHIAHQSLLVGQNRVQHATTPF